MAKEVKKTTKKVVKKAEVKPEVKLNQTVWSVPFNGDLVAQVVYVQRSNARVGTAAAKTKGMVEGGGRKPFKQKGTGRARAGSTRSPLWRKGGVTFVPTDRNWERKINKKMAKKAVCIMLSDRLRNDLLEFANMPSDSDLKKIRDGVLKAVNSTRSLVVSDNENVKLALKNVGTIDTIKPSDLNAYSLTKARKIIVESKAVELIEKQFANEK